MKIRFHCPSCLNLLQAQPKAAGQQRTCPRCQTSVVVPSSEPPLDSENDSERPPHEAWTPEANWQLHRVAPLRRNQKSRALFDLQRNISSEGLQVLKAFGPPVERTIPTVKYQIAVLAVAFVLILLPLIYFTGVGSICFAVYWYFRVGQYLLLGADPGWLGLGVATLVATTGTAIVFFSLKPLFTESINARPTRSLHPTDDPLLFAFVAKVCDSVGSPFPSRIDISYDINASASYRAGLASVLRGTDLVLTLGAPLIGTLTMRQFAGVLAHEFGHFSQGTGMRVTFVIRIINEWLARMVYERDRWDQSIQRLCLHPFPLFPVLLWPVRACIWLSRQLLRVLMNIGLLFSSLLLHEMEFDADRYEARVAGSDQFAATNRQIQMTSQAWFEAHQQLLQLADRDIYIDDISLLVRHRLLTMPDPMRTHILRQINEGTSGPFDSHPSDQQRHQNATRENSPGIFTLEEGAHELFADFQTLTQNVTGDFYSHLLGKRIDRKKLQDTQTVLLKYRMGVVTSRPWAELDFG